MKLYNTASRSVEEFKPIKDGEVKLYTCGPTVYSYYHVGNLRNAVFNDTLRRSLETYNYKVQHVMNITDVGHLAGDSDEGEDKLEKGAKKEGKSVWDIAKHYTQAFKDDLAKLNVLPPNGYKDKDDNYARATNFIVEQIEMIKILLDKGFTYQTTNAIYFDISKLSDYGSLSGQNLADKEVAARSGVVTDKNKRNPQDFAVWFFTVGHYADHTMRWDSPWGEGFPGWHLECSAIIHATLGDPIDIHTGAVDLIGTHHTNEIAQTQAAFGNKLANYWVHNEYLLIDGQRMAKSSNNFHTLRDVVDKGFDPLALRLLYLQAHYRTQMNFTWESLEAAHNHLKSLQAWADMRHQPSAETMPSELDELFDKTRADILRALQDDLSTPQAIAALDRLVNYMSHIQIPGIDGKHSDGTLAFLDAVFGLNLNNRPDITEAQKDLIKKREEARKKQAWEESDKIRNELESQGIELNDMPHHSYWSRA